MSDEELDDLPSITVVASASRESSWTMPSACELASEREREQRNEDELLALRQQTTATLPVPRSDSSGSESEVALAAAVTALHMRAPDNSINRSQNILSAITMFKESMPVDPDQIERDYLEVLQGPQRLLHQFTEKVVLAVSSSDHPCTWESRTRMSIARILCAAVLARIGVRARRALHHVLEGCTDVELTELAKRGGITLADAVRSGGRGEELAAMILKRELTGLADGKPDETDTVLTAEDIGALLSRCSSLSPDKHLLAVQLAGRALSVAGIHEATLPPLPRNRSLNPDVLKLALANARLQLIFRGDGVLSKFK